MPRPFVVVKSLTVRKSGQDVRPAPELEREKAKPAAQPRRQATRARRNRRGAEESVPEPEEERPERQDPTEMPPELRVVSGLEVDPLLNVRVELEIYNTGAEGK